MIINASVLKNQEYVAFRLRDLYRAYGYAQFKMSKFEEYDLYARNKDFLVSDSVITFTDTDGKLMALKPDVTLSIVKNTKDSVGLQKLYYDENVYRISGSSRTYREIMQTGLECIGDIDEYAVCEVLTLAAESLARISSDYVLDISQLDILACVLDSLAIDEKTRAELLIAVGEKNLHGLRALCEGAGADSAKTELLCSLVSLCGKPEKALADLHALLDGTAAASLLEGFERIISALVELGYGDRIRVDFSVIDDMKYYNGIVFKGFINGVPTDVLSGGAYDRLMQKMGRRAGAIGFAVYLDLLERLTEDRPEYDVHTVLLYDKDIPLAALTRAVQEINQARRNAVGGDSVLAVTQPPQGVRYKRMLRLSAEGMEEIK
ncbi:MAG: ATP phosphoribosyltransferase regulatory subunit [Clostridia bacterium]|nr:ATP phosphoribosyltransferase regulatory subunit [Clostridia bacterium]